MDKQFELLSRELVVTGKMLYERGWVPATSGNFSSRVSPSEIAVTVSGRHKGFLALEDIMRVDASGRPLDGKTPSAETELHTQIYRHFPAANAVLHTHSVNATVLSFVCEGKVELRDMEVLKAIEGIDSHAVSLQVPIFDNDQDIGRLAAIVEKQLSEIERSHAYLIKGHGLYTWGSSISDAVRHLEAFEFLFACEMEMRKVGGRYE